MSTLKNAKRQEEYLRTVYKPDAEGELQHLIEYLHSWGDCSTMLTLEVLYSYMA